MQNYRYRLTIKQITPHLYLLNDNNESTGYLVIGEKKALIIDTMNGYVDVHAVAREFTDLPLMVVNTHGHPDHIYGNVYFDQVYMHPADMELADRFYEHPMYVEVMKQEGMKTPEALPIKEGDVIDLGGLELEVYDVPGHTPGGICLLDRSDRILFSGDSIIEQCWMQLEESLPMEVFLKSLENLRKIREAYDMILCGHSRDVEDASLYEALTQAVREVCEGQNEQDEPYTYFEGTCMAHPYGKPPRRVVYNEKDK